MSTKSRGRGGPAAPVRGPAAGSDAVRFFQALGDATRLDLLDRLREGERTVGELVDALRCPQPKVSRHLKVLKDAGLVADRRDGRHVTYSVTDSRQWSPEAREWLSRLDTAPPSRRTQAPASPAGKRRTPRPTGRAAPPAGDKPAPQRPTRRPEMETHLL